MHRIIAAARGRSVWLRETVRTLGGNGGLIREWIGTYTNIAERKRTGQTHNRLIALLDVTPDFVNIADPDGRMLYINAAGRRMLGIGSDEDISSLAITDNHPPWAYELIRNEGIPKATEEGRWRGETALLDRLGREIPVSQIIIAYKTEDGRIEFIASVARDISESKRLEEGLRHQATHDPLTGIANRALLSESLEQALRLAKRQRHLVEVLFVDIDDFKRINDTLGHAGGDEILRAVAERLSECLRETDMIARYGGDEFVVVLSHIYRVGNASRVLQEIQEAFTHPFVVDGQELLLTCSIGIAIYPEDGRDAKTLLKKADATMYSVKEVTRAGQLSVQRARAKRQFRGKLSGRP